MDEEGDPLPDKPRFLLPPGCKDLIEATRLPSGEKWAGYKMSADDDIPFGDPSGEGTAKPPEMSPFSVKALALLLQQPPSAIMAYLLQKNILVNLHAELDLQTAIGVCEHFRGPGTAKSSETILRLARADDVLTLEALIMLSVLGLQAATYSEEQMEAALGPVFGVDRQLIRDGTYYVVETLDGIVVAGGGWSRRNSVFGSDQARAGEDALLDPAHDPARIRAFFVHPAWARRGIGRKLLQHCEEALVAAGFREAILVATLAGEPLYRSAGYQEQERYELELAGGVKLPMVRMRKRFGRS